MARNYKSQAKPVVKNLTIPGRTKRDYSSRKSEDFLPRYLRSDINKKFLDATLDQLIGNGSAERINAFYGSKTGLVNNPQQDFYQTSTNKLKEDFRLAPGIVSRPDGYTSETKVHLTYDDIINRIDYLKGITTNHDKLFQDINYVWRSIINPNKLINFNDYYWFEFDLPVCVISTEVNPLTDVIGNPYFTFSGNSVHPPLRLINGLKIAFDEETINMFPDLGYTDRDGYFVSREYIVEGVGDKIMLIDLTKFSRKTPYTDRVPIPWDTTGWDSNNAPWDGSDDIPNLKDYIVMQRGACDRNAWSRVNQWYHINAIKLSYNFNNLVLTERDLDSAQAKRPIIEFWRDYRLYNFGTQAVSTVKEIITDKSWPASVMGSSGDVLTPGGREVFEGDVFMFNTPDEPQYYSRMWRATQVGVNLQWVLVTTTSGVNGYPALWDKILDTVTGFEYYWNGDIWFKGQQKLSENQSPLFDLYDHSGLRISDTSTFPNNNFTGNTVFEFKLADTRILDSELGISVLYNDSYGLSQGVFKKFANIVFTNTLEQDVYSYNLDTVPTEIVGYYYLRNNCTGEFNCGWDPVKTVNRVKLHENRVIKKGTTTLDIDLKTDSWDGTLNQYREYEFVYTSAGYEVYEILPFAKNKMSGLNPDIFITRDQAYNFIYNSGTSPLSIVDKNGNIWTGGVIGASPITSGTFTININSQTYPNLEYLYYNGVAGRGRIYIIDQGTQEHFPEVRYNGKLCNYQVDFDIINNHVVMPIANNITPKVVESLAENDVVDVYYTSNENVANPTYTVSESIKNNPNNDTFGNIAYNEVWEHFTTLLNNYNGFNGYAFGKNNFEELPRQLGVQGTIQQHENNMLLVGPLFGNFDYSIVNALRYNGDQVDRFRNKFKQTVTRIYEQSNANTPIYRLVDLALEDINFGKSSEFPYAHSGMAYYSNITEYSYTADGTDPIYEFESAIELGEYAQHVYVYVDGVQLLVDRDYTISTTEIQFTSAPTGAVVVRVANKNASTYIPTTLPKMLLEPATLPELGADYLICHDGARWEALSEFDKVNQAILDLEYRIYNHLEAATKTARLDRKLYPSRSRVHFIGGYEYLDLAEDRFNSYIISKGYSVAQKDQLFKNVNWNTNAFEKNYSSTAKYPYSPGYYKGMYNWLFDTITPHLTPWHSLGYNIKPSWWDAHYPSPDVSGSWGDAQKVSDFKEAMRVGNVAEPDTPYQIDLQYARGSASAEYPVTPTGQLMDPYSAGLAADPGVNGADDFKFGDMYGIEAEWQNTTEFRFAIYELRLILQPGTFLKDWNTNLYTTSINGERVLAKTMKRTTPADLLMHRQLDDTGNELQVSGINQILVEYLRSKNQDGTELATDIKTLEPALSFKLEGFTDARTVRLVTDGINSNNDRFVPEEDFEISLYLSPPLEEYTMSSISITWTGDAYEINGKDNVEAFFTVLPSDRNGKTTDIQFGSDTIVKFLSWSDTSQQVLYGTEYTRRSDVYDLFIAYGRWLTKIGFVFDNEKTFEDAAGKFINWSKSTLSPGDTIVISPFEDKVVFDANGKGFIGNTRSLINEVYNIKDLVDKEITGKDINVSRLDNLVTILPTGEQKLYFTRLYTSEYDHAVTLSGITRFEDIIYKSVFGMQIHRIKFVGQKTGDWFGAPKANGYLLADNLLVQNFEKTVNDVDRGLFDVEETVLNPTMVDAARHNIGYTTQDYLKKLLFNKDVSFEFWKGLIHKKGTPSSYKNLLRSIDIDNEISDVEVQEEWMFKLGEYGGQGLTKNYEIELTPTDLKHNPQIVNFVQDIREDRVTNKELQYDTRVTVTTNDTRWVNKPEGSISFPTLNDSAYNAVALPSAGNVWEHEATFMLFDENGFRATVAPEILPYSIPNWINGVEYDAGAQVRYNGRVWEATTSSDSNGLNEPNVLQFVQIEEPELPTFWLAKNANGTADLLKAQDDTYAIIEICAGLTSQDQALVKCDKAHNLAVGDFVMIVNSSTTPSVNGVHRVSNIQSDEWFLIDAYISTKGFTGKFFPLRTMMFADVDAMDAAITDPRYKIRQNDIVYTPTAVYRYNGSLTGTWNIIRTSDAPVDNTALTNVRLYNNAQNNIIAEFEAYDPRKGIIPGRAQKEINSMSYYDNAVYSHTNSDSHTDEVRYWGVNKLGTTWWDTSSAVFQNTEQTSATHPEYRHTHWGKLHPSASIDIYEWTQGTVTPDKWSTAKQGQGVPYYLTDPYGNRTYFWSEEELPDPVTGQMKIYYFYWVRNKTSVPNINNRQLSTTAMARMIENPTRQGILWCSATGESDLLIANSSNYVVDNNCVLEFTFKSGTVPNHEEWMLLRENDSDIPVFFHKRMRDSMVGQSTSYQSFSYTTFSHTVDYPFGSIVEYNNAIYRATANNTPRPFASGAWQEQYRYKINNVGRVELLVFRPVPDLDQHPLMRYGNQTRPAQAWFEFKDSARRVFVESANRLLAQMNLVDEILDWDKTLGLTAYDTGTATYDVTKYWSYVDWFNADWDRSGLPEKDIANRLALESETPTANRLIRVLNDGQNRYEIYLGNGTDWVLVEKQNATIELSGKLWDFYIDNSGWDMDPFDSGVWDEYPTVELFNIINALRYDVFVGDYKVNYNKLWFSMIYYTMSEQEKVDWIAKTTLLQVKTRSQGNIQINLYNKEISDTIVEYISEIKPFHTKLRNVFNIKEFDDATTAEITEDSRTGKIVLKFDRHGKPRWNQTMVDAANFWVLEPGYDMAPWEAIYTNWPNFVSKARSLDGTLKERQAKYPDGSPRFDQWGMPVMETFWEPKQPSDYDVEPHIETSTRPWDVDRQTLEDLYIGTIYDGYGFQRDTQRDASDTQPTVDTSKVTTDDDAIEDPIETIVEGNAFIQPHYEGYPEEEVPVLPFDAVSIRVQTNTSGSTETGASRTFHLFKDMLGDFHIHRVNDLGKTMLNTNIDQITTSIEVQDASVLTVSDAVNLVPGVIWIGSERIEYWGINGNILVNCARGTLGTAAQSHQLNDMVVDQGRQQDIPGIARFVRYGDQLKPAFNDAGTELQNSTNAEANFINQVKGTIW